jgi:segregation and condensation protein B
MVEVVQDIVEEPVDTIAEEMTDEAGPEETMAEETGDAPVEETAEAPGEESAEETASDEPTADDVEHALQDYVQETRIVEALLFAATEPVSTDFLAERLPEGADIGAILEDLRTLYEDRGVNLARVAGKWSLRTAEDLSPHLRIERKVSRKPSRAAVESLAIIAYHQPVTRSEVEEIRGVSVSKGSFDVLLEAGWIKPVGRRRTPGRPTTWGTTPNFLEEFGLDSLADLPGIDELKASGLLDTRPAGTIIGDSGEMYNDAEAEGAPEEDEPEALTDGDDVNSEGATEAEGETSDTAVEPDSGETDMDVDAEPEASMEAEVNEEPEAETRTG